MDGSGPLCMNRELQEVVPQLTAAVEAMMNPLTPQNRRLEAYQLCENFKETSQLCAPCGILMSVRDNSPVVRHFGLQLLEHCIRFRWYDMSQKDKVFIKENAMKLMMKGTNDLLVEEAHIKDALSRIVVEMMKREWPQQWPSLMQELDDICKQGPTQTELVLLVFLRVAEDVVTFMAVPTKRRREMMQALTTHMSKLFIFFLQTLKENFENYQQEPEPRSASCTCRVTQAVLKTLTGYLDWVTTPVIIDHNGLLLQFFCLMLSEERLQLDAAECLLLVTSRKGKAEDRKPLLVLFSEDAMATILNAIVKTSSGPLDEYRYLFLKRLCQVLTTLGSQLCALWGQTEGVSQPPNFSGYLKAIQAFSEHPSQTLGSLTQSLWASFLRHEHISHDPVLLAAIPAVAEVCKSAFLKVGFPSQNNSPSCGYSQLDFDSDEDFKSFYSKYRAEVSETLRLMTLLAPNVTFSVMAAWLDDRLQKSSGAHDLCTPTSPELLEWDALTSFMENVMARLFASTEPKPPVEEGVRLAKAVLYFDTKDPLILSCILSCISTLSPYITEQPELLCVTLEKIFSTAVFSIEGQTKATRSRAVKNVRRHACSVLVKICKRYPKLLLQMFDLLYTHVQRLSSDPEELSQMEKCTLMEALVLISNEFRDYGKQCKFTGELLTEVKKFWLSNEFREALMSVEKFITYIGIDQPPVEPSSADTCGINRSHMTYCINLIMAVMKRCQWPEDSEEAKACGFLMTTPEGLTALRNPSFPHMGRMLENVLYLLRTLNALWMSENLARRHPDFSQAYEPCANDRLALLGINQPQCLDNYDAPANKRPLARMQNFISTSHDNCYHILGNAGSCLGLEFYSLPNLAQFMLNTVFTNLDSVPNHRLKPILRVFLKPYIQACPKEYFSPAVLPLLAATCPFMLERLDGQWKTISQRVESRVESGEEEDPESQEVLEDQLVRLLTRDYLELLGVVCLNRRGSPSSVARDGGEDAAMDDGEGDLRNNAPGKDDTLSDLGQSALSEEGIAPALIISVFNGFCWGDGPTAIKCTIVAWPILKYMMGEKRISAEDACQLFSAELQGLQLHGEHEGIQAAFISLAMNTYELFRPEFPIINKVLLQIPGNTTEDIKAFEEKLSKPISDKKKREVFKKLVEEVIGKSLSQKFSNISEIKDLPPLYKRAKAKRPALDAVEKSDMGLCALFAPESEGTNNHA